MAKKRKVSFIATKKISKPVKVTFRTEEGIVSFKATKRVSKPIKVTFYVRRKRGKR